MKPCGVFGLCFGNGRSEETPLDFEWGGSSGGAGGGGSFGAGGGGSNTCAG